jgi:hypothetical protein
LFSDVDEGVLFGRGQCTMDGCDSGDDDGLDEAVGIT